MPNEALALPRMYAELAPWFHLVTKPEEYAEEAEFYRRLMLDNAAIPVRTVLELGSGGGNNASHLKAHFHLTLVDPSPGMLALSATINPECEHLDGDMRSVRLGRLFDAVFVHDAVSYMTSEPDLAAAMRTAFVHCRPGGAALFAPDHVREKFREQTDHGGHDGVDGRSLRYLEWTWDPDLADDTYQTDYAYLLRDADGSVRALQDSHVLGLFSRETWLRLLREAGFAAPAAITFDHSGLEPDTYEVFVARRPPDAAP